MSGANPSDGWLLLSQLDPTGRFSSLASLYARHRPDYPAAVLDCLQEKATLRKGDPIVDLGAGTGIFSRQLAARGFHVVAIEPNEAMRKEAIEAGGAPDYRPGTAESTGLPDGCAAAVVAAQAYHWFDPPPTLAEMHRILRPDGWVALIWNERDTSDPFTAAYGAILTAYPGARAVEASRHAAGQTLLESPRFREGELRTFAHFQDLEEEGLLGRFFSASYAPQQGPEALECATALRSLHQRFRSEGKVRLCYITSVYLARRLD